MKNKKALLLSALIWGSGQFFVCKQKVKGAIFFAAQALFIGIELSTGYWFEYALGMFDDFSLRLHGGYFTKGIWGLITLGEIPGAKTGDHSTVLLVSGVICLIFILIFIGIYVLNLVDANKSAKRVEKGTNESTKGEFYRIWNKGFAYIVLAPIFLVFIFVVVMPIIVSVLTAFTNYNRDHLPPLNLVSWVGFENFIKLFTVPVWSNTFMSVLLWNIFWAVAVTFLTYFMGMFQAIILNSSVVKCKVLFRTILILPWAMPQMISLLVFRNLFNSQFGPINQLLMDLGLITEKLPFLTETMSARTTVILLSVWFGFPMFMVMMLGVLANIDKSLYEAAAIDGADKRRIFSKITFPLVSRATAPLLVMSLAGNFNGFGLIYFLTNGGPVNPNYQFAGDTDILISWIYKLTLDQQMYNMAAVMSILIFAFVGVVSFWNFKRTTSFKDL